MKTLILRVPVRPEPTVYPPFGSMAVMQSLRQGGYEFSYYDLDVHRPTFDQVKSRILEENPQIIGISAVVSTSYKYAKKLIEACKEVSPNLIVIVGGGLAWNSRLLIERCQVDFCVIGEGLVTARELVGAINLAQGRPTDEVLRNIKGITFKTQSGMILFSGFRDQIKLADQEIDDYSLIDKDEFIIDPITVEKDSGWLLFRHDKRSYEPHRRGKKLMVMVTSKGCVARCTFCHRMEKGIRLKANESLLDEIKRGIEELNAGFFFFGDEDFGASKKWVEEFCAAVKPLNILFSIQGMRVTHVTQENLMALKDAGCVSIFYGTESGSQRMLNVMQKSTTLEQNLNACIWTAKAGILTSYQFVLGMPGETDETISETMDFIKKITEILPSRDLIRVSSKYIMVLPSTPTYEYAVKKGYIGTSLDEEEEYLLKISNTDPDIYNPGFINLTECDFYTVANWERRILWEPWVNYDRVNKIKTRGVVETVLMFFVPGGLRTLSKERNRYLYWLLMNPLNLPYHIYRDRKHNVGWETVWKRVGAHVRYKFAKRFGKADFEYVSLRKNSAMTPVDPYAGQDDSMRLVRAGR